MKGPLILGTGEASRLGPIARLRSTPPASALLQPRPTVISRVSLADTIQRFKHKFGHPTNGESAARWQIRPAARAGSGPSDVSRNRGLEQVLPVGGVIGDDVHSMNRHRWLFPMRADSVVRS